MRQKSGTNASRPYTWLHFIVVNLGDQLNLYLHSDTLSRLKALKIGNVASQQITDLVSSEL